MEALTVGDLIAALEALPRTLSVLAVYDGGCAYGPVMGVEVEPDAEEPHVALQVY